MNPQLSKFLQNGDRGALIVNTEFRAPQSPQEPAFDWISYDDAVETRDRILQESIAFYEPLNQVLVFVFLLSKTKNSMAIWRRKLQIPEQLQVTYALQIAQVKATLPKEYRIYVDE